MVMQSQALGYYICSFLWLVIISLIVSTSSSLNIPRLSATRGARIAQALSTYDSFELETFYYTQTLDHFNFRYDSFATFQQRYLINFKHWGGSNTSAPIFAYLGAEESLDRELSFHGFLPDNAKQFQALQIYIEHRYYGKSIPFGSRETAFKNARTLGYFNSAQALADCAEILIHVKKKLHAEHSPIIVVGGSYGGMLASWFRLKYPHVALGALASSAPILYFDEIVSRKNGYYSIISRDFQETSESCYQTIKKSWSEIEEIASKPNGLSVLSKKFHTCSPLGSSSELEDHLEFMYIGAAQYDAPPTYPVTEICGAIDGVSSKDTLAKIFAGLVAYEGKKSCYVNDYQPGSESLETVQGWAWQICSEMVMPIGNGNNNTMLPPAPFDLKQYIAECKAEYGVPPRPHWVTTYYGGHDIRLALHRFASNIIFSNGLRDPYSGGGVLHDISDTVLAVTTTKGSHCLDLLRANHTTDPAWLVNQRKTEVRIIKGWMLKYYADLQAFK
ncbi:uncharacterized protein LOC126787304 [Argentina anserina]|uniref:uncharacterized protein LOC126787304 n=1 Tax=Argentina anserina TaxID=57926 RepID=UPI0021767F6C|nr:uncharacterized protein LOC126787304 [Potentilla anserina]